MWYVYIDGEFVTMIDNIGDLLSVVDAYKRKHGDKVVVTVEKMQ